MLKQNTLTQEEQTASVVHAIAFYSNYLKMEKVFDESVFKRNCNAVIQILENRGFSRTKKDLIQNRSDQALELGTKLLQMGESAEAISQDLQKKSALALDVKHLQLGEANKKIIEQNKKITNHKRSWQ